MQKNLVSRIFLIILRVKTIDEKSQQNQNANEPTLDTDLPTAQRPSTSPTIEVQLLSWRKMRLVEVPGCFAKNTKR